MYLREHKSTRKSDSYGDGVVYNIKSRLGINELLDTMENFTEVYESHRLSHPALREAACYRVQYPATMLDVADIDLFVGRSDVLPLGVSPQYLNGECCYVFKIDWFEDALSNTSYSEEQKSRLEALFSYWENRESMGKINESTPLEIQQYIHVSNWYDGPLVYRTSHRLSGIYLDYEKLLSLGLPGLLDAAKAARAIPGADPEFLQGVRESLQVVIDTSLWYAGKLMRMAREEIDDARSEELFEMARVCRRITYSKPESFREALQLVYLYTVIAGSRQWGRMDDYLADYYAHDIEYGIITEEKAIDLLTSFWRLIISKEQITDDRIIIGGRGRRREARADELALVILETSKRVKDIVPQLTLRYYEGMNEIVYNKALDVIGAGATFPILYNDDSVIGDIMKVFGVNEEEAKDWMPFGCGEYVLNHRGVNTPNTIMNVANIFWGTLNNGREPVRGLLVTPDRGNLTDFDTFDDLFEAYAASVTDHVAMAAFMEGRSYDFINREICVNLISTLCDDCLARGLPLLSGGARYKDGILEMYGVITTADSLYSIKKLVYDDKKITKERMLEALKVNFEGYEEEQAMMLAVPKYGNGNKDADNMAAKVCEQYCLAALSHSGKYGMRRFWTVNINNNGNTWLGIFTGATPDGRPMGKALSNGNSPTSGMDKNGVTALLHSMVRTRTDIHVGAVQNLKFSKEVFSDMRDSVVKPLLKTYFNEGGAQVMITVVGREDLEAARKKPQDYLNLIVRVGGLSARYVELAEETQLEILERTMY
ncbi:MAG: hypothetical protein FWH55_00280 [Oscillospiraceae bacterium]|nr:hypothetical protein [Oscillospiraceae bacterium]